MMNYGMSENTYLAIAMISVIVAIVIYLWAHFSGMNDFDEEEDDIFEDETPDCSVNIRRVEYKPLPSAEKFKIDCLFTGKDCPYVEGSVRAQAWKEQRRC